MPIMRVYDRLLTAINSPVYNRLQCFNKCKIPQPRTSLPLIDYRLVITYIHFLLSDDDQKFVDVCPKNLKNLVFRFSLSMSLLLLQSFGKAKGRRNKGIKETIFRVYKIHNNI